MEETKESLHKPVPAPRKLQNNSKPLVIPRKTTESPKNEQESEFSFITPPHLQSKPPRLLPQNSLESVDQKYFPQRNLGSEDAPLKFQSSLDSAIDVPWHQKDPETNMPIYDISKSTETEEQTPKFSCATPVKLKGKPPRLLPQSSLESEDQKDLSHQNIESRVSPMKFQSTMDSSMHQKEPETKMSLYDFSKAIESNEQTPMFSYLNPTDLKGRPPRLLPQCSLESEGQKDQQNLETVLNPITLQSSKDLSMPPLLSQRDDLDQFSSKNLNSATPKPLPRKSLQTPSLTSKTVIVEKTSSLDRNEVKKKHALPSFSKLKKIFHKKERLPNAFYKKSAEENVSEPS